MAPTCLYCDKPLVFKCETKWENQPVPLCPKCGGKRHVQHGDQDYANTIYGKDTTSRTMLYCSTCGVMEPPRFWQERKVVSRERYRDKPGPYGDGFFCSLKCGHRFAVAAAKAGYRLVKNGA